MFKLPIDNTVNPTPSYNDLDSSNKLDLIKKLLRPKEEETEEEDVLKKFMPHVSDDGVPKDIQKEKLPNLGLDATTSKDNSDHEEVISRKPASFSTEGMGDFGPTTVRTTKPVSLDTPEVEKTNEQPKEEEEVESKGAFAPDEEVAPEVKQFDTSKIQPKQLDVDSFKGKNFDISQWADVIKEQAEKHNVPASVMIAQMLQESGFNPEAIDFESREAAKKLGITPEEYIYQKNPKTGRPYGGAVGLGQFRLASAKERGLLDEEFENDPDELWDYRTDPKESIRALAEYDAQHLDKFGGDVNKMIMSHKMGEGWVAKNANEPGWEQRLNDGNKNYLASVAYRASTGDFAGAGTRLASATIRDEQPNTIQPKIAQGTSEESDDASNRSPASQTDYLEKFRTAQGIDASNRFTSGMLRAGIQAGAAIAGVKPDYSATEDLKTNWADQVKGEMAIAKTQHEMGVQDEMNDYRSASSKLARQAFKNLTGLDDKDVPETMTAAQFKNLSEFLTGMFKAKATRDLGEKRLEQGEKRLDLSKEKFSSSEQGAADKEEQKLNDKLSVGDKRSSTTLANYVNVKNKAERILGLREMFLVKDPKTGELKYDLNKVNALLKSEVVSNLDAMFRGSNASTISGTKAIESKTETIWQEIIEKLKNLPGTEGQLPALGQGKQIEDLFDQVKTQYNIARLMMIEQATRDAKGVAMDRWATIKKQDPSEYKRKVVQDITSGTPEEQELLTNPEYRTKITPSILANLEMRGVKPEEILKSLRGEKGAKSLDELRVTKGESEKSTEDVRKQLYNEKPVKKLSKALAPGTLLRLQDKIYKVNSDGMTATEQ